MANCTNCNNRLPFFKVILLSETRNGIKCKSCEKTLKAEKSFLGIINLIGLLGIPLIFWNKEIFGDQSLSLIMAVASSLLLFIAAMLIQNRFIKLRVAESQDD